METSPMKGRTHEEGGRYYAIITLLNGHEYYSGAFNSRSSAYRYSVKETRKHRLAVINHMTYNTKAM